MGANDIGHFDRRQLDLAFPTVVRYCGVLLTVILVIGSILGHGIELAAGYVAAAGMILYKSVHDAANGKDDDPHEDAGGYWRAPSSRDREG